MKINIVMENANIHRKPELNVNIVIDLKSLPNQFLFRKISATLIAQDKI